LSMGSIGDPWDNAVAQTFFASLEKELLRRERFATREAARMRIFWYMECFYNTRRRHSGLGYLSPADDETHHQQEAIAAEPSGVNQTGSIPIPSCRASGPSRSSNASLMPSGV
jgi:putative transposase